LAPNAPADPRIHALLGSGNTRDPYWDNAAKQLMHGLTALLLEHEEDERHVNISSVIRLALKGEITGVANGPGKLRKVAENLPPDSLAGCNLNAFLSLTAARTLVCIMSNFFTATRLFTVQKSLTAMLSETDFDMGKIGLEKTAVFLITQDEKTTLNFLVSLFVKQLYQVLIDKAQESGGRLPVRVNFLLDEFAQLPKIPDMASMMSAARSRNIRFALYVQSLKSLESKYGGCDAHTIMANCVNRVFLTSRELPLLRELSELCGTDQYDKPLLTISDLQRLSKRDGEALVLCERLYPYVTALPDIDDYPFAKTPPAPLTAHNGKFDSGFDVDEFMRELLCELGGGTDEPFGGLTGIRPGLITPHPMAGK
jgi:type IV secretion system protein VirD4